MSFGFFQNWISDLIRFEIVNDPDSSGKLATEVRGMKWQSSYSDQYLYFAVSVSTGNKVLGDFTFASIEHFSKTKEQAGLVDCF